MHSTSFTSIAGRRYLANHLVYYGNCVADTAPCWDVRPPHQGSRIAAGAPQYIPFVGTSETEAETVAYSVYFTRAEVLTFYGNNVGSHIPESLRVF